MSFYRILWAIIFPAMIAWSFSKQLEHERTANRLGVVLDKKPGRVTMAYQSPLIMPGMLFMFVVFSPLEMGIKPGLRYVQDLMLEVFIILSVYYVILLCCLPLLRKMFSARACTTLWILPAFLYWLPHMWRNYPIKPRLVLRLPPQLAEILTTIWLVGFLAVLVWKITSHLLFRREVLSDSYPVTDPEILALWEREQQLIERKKTIPLIYSDRIVSPMTIGRSNKAIRTLLPQRSYTRQELRLIFRHELRHVQRLDVDTKIFYAFCEALCWFNPLVWIAMRNAAADLELSCDEMVLYGREEDQRRQYAELLLDSAGDDRGFTTCLSASAKTLRYRLKNVMQERRRLSGTILVGLSLAALLLCCGVVVVSRTYGTLDEVLFSNYGDLTIDFILLSDQRGLYSSDDEEIFAWDEESLIHCLKGVAVTKVAGRGPVLELDASRELLVGFQTDNIFFYFWCNDNCLRIDNGPCEGIYRIDSPLDWNMIESCLDFTAPDPDPSPVRPWLDYYISHWESADEPFLAEDRLIAKVNADGVWSPDTPLTDWDQAGGLSTFPLPEDATVRFAFSYDPVWYTIEVNGRNGEEAYTVKGEDLPDNTMQLAPYSANYCIKAFFQSYRNTTYDMEFYFRIEFPEQG